MISPERTQVWIDLVHSFDEHRKNGFFVSSASDSDGNEVVGAVVHRLVFGRVDILVEADLTYIANDADDLAYRLRVEIAVGDLLSDGILAGEVFFRKRLVDDNLLRLRSIVVFRKQPATNQLRLECGEIGWSYVALIHFIVLAMERFADNANPVGIAVALDRQVAGDAHRLDSRQSREATNYLAK